MNIIFKNAKILTLTDGDKKEYQHCISRNTVLIVQNHQIVFIGDEKEKIEFLQNQRIQESDFQNYDCKGNLLMPSFKNMHTHSAMPFARGICDSNDLQTWLSKKIIPIEKTIGKEDVYFLTLLSILEYLRNGITLAVDMYYYPEEIFRAALDTDFRLTVIDGYKDDDYNIDKTQLEFEKKTEKYSDKNLIVDDCARKSHVYSKDYDSELIDYKMGLHSIYTNSENTIKLYSKVLNKLKKSFFTHLSETLYENESIFNKKHVSPTRYCIEEGLFNYGGGAFHSVHLSNEDIVLYKKYNISPIICMGSNLRLKSGIANVKKYLDNGLKVSLGTDGAGSNDKLSVFREMYLTASLGSINEKFNISASDILDMACINGGNLLGIDNLGPLKVGCDADIILINLNLPNAQPCNNIVENIVYSMGDENVLMTMCRGKILYDRGQYNLDKINFDIIDKAKERNMIIQLSERIFENLRINMK